MGINGLHAELKPYCRRVHVEKYRGKRVAADGYSWLHKGVYSCATLVAQARATQARWTCNTGADARTSVAQGLAPWLARGRRAPYVEYCLKRVRCRAAVMLRRRLRGLHGSRSPWARRAQPLPPLRSRGRF